MAKAGFAAAYHSEGRQLVNALTVVERCRDGTSHAGSALGLRRFRRNSRPNRIAPHDIVLAANQDSTRRTAHEIP